MDDSGFGDRIFVNACINRLDIVPLAVDDESTLTTRCGTNSDYALQLYEWYLRITRIFMSITEPTRRKMVLESLSYRDRKMQGGREGIALGGVIGGAIESIDSGRMEKELSLGIST